MAGARRALYAVWLALALPPVLLPIWALVALVPSRRLGFALARFASRAGLRLMGCRLEASGLERLPRGGAAGARVQPRLLRRRRWRCVALLPIDVLFVAKREVLGYPLVSAASSGAAAT